jgi:glycosyltransferase involved in cell wall biosynthesis
MKAKKNDSKFLFNKERIPLENGRHKVAIVYHFWAHYREPIARLMCQQDAPGPEYTIFSDPKSNEPGLKTIAPSKADIPVQEGGLRWRFVKNAWLFGTKVFLWQKGVLKLAWGKEFDTIIFLGSMYFISTWVAVILARLRGKRVLMWSHGFIRNEKGLKGWLRKTFYKLSHGMLLYGNRARNIMIGMGFDPKRLYVVFNSLDYDKQLKLRNLITDRDILEVKRKLFHDIELPLLLFVGRLTEQKCLHLLAEAAEKLLVDGILVNVLFVGDGPVRRDLEITFDDCGLSERTCFYGACYNEIELATLITAADLCIAPGEVGLTAMHSLVYGTPIITHNDPSFQGPEFEAIVPGKSGAFFKKDNSNALAEQIRGWLAGNLDRQLVRQQCHEVIDAYYNPHFQLRVLNAAVSGEQNAEDLLPCSIP